MTYSMTVDRKLHCLSHKVISDLIHRGLLYHSSVRSKPVPHIYTHHLLPVMELHLVKLLPHMTTQQSLLHPLIYISVEPFGDGLFWKSESNHIHAHSLYVTLG